MPPPRVHRHRYHGVLAPNSPLRAQVTALAKATTEATPIFAFVTETPSVRAILEHIGEPTRPPAIAPPAFDDPPVELEPDDDPLAQPEPEMEFDQRIHW